MPEINVKEEILKQEFCNTEKKSSKWIIADKGRRATYSCSSCNKVFHNPRTLRSHKTNDCGKKYVCMVCEEVFTYRASYCKHRKRCSMQTNKLRTRMSI